MTQTAGKKTAAGGLPVLAKILIAVGLAAVLVYAGFAQSRYQVALYGGTSNAAPSSPAPLLDVAPAAMPVGPLAAAPVAAQEPVETLPRSPSRAPAPPQRLPPQGAPVQAPGVQHGAKPKGKLLPMPSGPSPFPAAEVKDEAYVFYWYEMTEEQLRQVKGHETFKKEGKAKTWADLARNAHSYSPVMCIYVAIWSLRRVGVKRKILFLSTNAEAADDPILKWLGVEVRVVPLLQAVCKQYPGIPYRRVNNVGQFTKLAVFDQTDLKAAVYLDADAVFVRSLDDDIALFTRSKHSMGVIPYYKANHCAGSQQEWDYEASFHRLSHSRKCLQDEFNCGLMFMRPSSAEYKAALKLTEDKELFWDPKCGEHKNKCYLGEADFMHQLIRKRFGGKVHCMPPPVECLGSDMHKCDGDRVKMVHWAGARKPWREWWNDQEHKPRPPAKKDKCGGGQCQAVAVESVKLWWRMHDELSAALSGDLDPLKPTAKLRPRGRGAALRFFQD